MNKYLSLIIFIACFKTSFAQSDPSKVVFFRPAYSWFTDNPGRLKLLEHGKALIKLRRNDAAVYAIPGKDSAVLNYTFKSMSFGAAICKLKIENTPNTIHFVRFYRRNYVLFIRYKAREISKEEFVNYYKDNKWLRDKLAKQGYHSSEELLKGAR